MTKPTNTSLSSNREVINAFYTAFEKKDAQTMVSFYHDSIVFTDPAFGTLKGERAKSMWKMLCESGKDLKVEFSDVKAAADSGSAHWEAYYTFSQTGRKVHNIIDAKFEFKDGKIIRHIDDFNLHKWAGQALGFTGKLLGWTGFFRNKLQAQTQKLLDKYMADNGSRPN